jgi:3-oxoacyl-[acyl-carrier-protein] synthase I
MSYILSDNIITSIGFSTEEVLASIEQDRSGISDFTSFSALTAAPLSLINREQLNNSFRIDNESAYTFFEQITIISVLKALEKTTVKLSSPDTLLILSTTKGNIELLGAESDAPISDGLVASAAATIAGYFKCYNSPQVVCNACISGVLALIVADRYIKAGKYKNIVVVGADVVTNFVVAGFESFKSMSSVPCQPFDANRTGLSLGEGAGTIVLGQHAGENSNAIKIVGGGSANDANHISGPSRTAEGAFLAATRALNGNKKIDFISAHGTATPYNDDMESVAISRLGLEEVPVNSFKGYFGHTLGAAGVVESILTIRSMMQNRLFKTLGLEEQGVASSINIIKEHSNKELNRSLKISSGFGGCNAAIVFEKNV